MRWDWRDILVRFLFGGSAVVASYLVSLAVPWPSLAGVFAAFPAVMGAAIMMTGYKHGSSAAGEVALGAVAGMLGGIVCILAAVTLIPLFHNWGIGLFLSLFVWFGAATIFNRLFGKVKEKTSARTG